MLAIEHFGRGVDRFSDRDVVVYPQGAITYRDMDEIAVRIGQMLMRSGVGPDDKVAILSVNHPMVLACQYGLLKAGAIWVPVNYRNTAQENARQLAALDVKWLFFHSDLGEQIPYISEHVPAISGYVSIDQKLPGFAFLSDWSEPGGAEPVAFPNRLSTDHVALLSTSGTTGLPKGAMHSNRSWETMIASYYAMMPFEEPPVHLVVAPLTHAAGVLHYAFLARGATTVLLDSADPAAILAAIEKYKISLLFLPPTVIYMCLAHPDVRKHDYSSLKYLVYGAAPMSVEKLKEAMQVFGPVMMQNYGQTECLMMAVVLTPADHAEILRNPDAAHRIAAAGREAPFCRVDVMADDGAIMPRGEVGEIVFRSDYVMDGYYKDPEGTATVSTFGWHHTGDVGFKDKDGYVYLVDRKRDMIISGGFNVFPGEVEQVVMAHASVQDCVVVGVPHEKWGEMVIAAVQLKEGAQLDEQDVIAMCKERLGSVKAPKRIEIWETLPRSTVGKTLRRVVRDKYWGNAARKI